MTGCPHYEHYYTKSVCVYVCEYVKCLGLKCMKSVYSPNLILKCRLG